MFLEPKRGRNESAIVTLWPITPLGRSFMSLRRPWTEQEEQELLELAARGFSMPRLSARLRRTQSAIEGRLSILRARSRKRATDAESVPQITL